MSFRLPDQSRISRWIGLAAGALASVLSVATLTAADEKASTPAKPAAPAASQAPQRQPASLKPKYLEVAPVAEVYNQRQSLLLRGETSYRMYCAGCHGVKGDGNGPAALRLITKPRDFTKGIYKFRSTNSSSLPLDADLHRTITRGLPGSSMPAFPLIPEQERVALVEYIKSFYPKWSQEAPDRVTVMVPSAPRDLASPERIGRGRVVYLAMGCGNCHGSNGAGLNATMTQYTDAWGNPQKALNFTRGRLKSGEDPEDIYRAFHTGLRSIMPEFGGENLAYVVTEQVAAQQPFFVEGEPKSLEPFLAQFAKDSAAVGALSAAERAELVLRNSWDLVAYIQSLRQGSGTKVVAAQAVLPAAPSVAAPKPPASAGGDAQGY